MTNAPFGNIDLSPAYKQLEILQVSKVHSLEVGNFHFKSMNNLLPVQIVKFFPTSADRVIHHSYGLKSCNQIQAPRFSFNSTTGRKSIQYTGSKIWEDLPADIKNSETFMIFKKSYKKHVLENQ